MIEQDHPVLGRIRMPNLPFRFSDCDCDTQTRSAVCWGQHNREIAVELGVSSTEIAAMIRDGVLHQEDAVVEICEPG